MAAIKPAWASEITSFAAFTLDDAEGNIAALTDLRYHEVHRFHPGIQAPGTIAAAVATSTVCALTFLSTQLLIVEHANHAESIAVKPEDYRGSIREMFGI